MTALNGSLQRIYLLRHAQAAWPMPGESDFDRSLDDKGQSEAAALAGSIAEKGYLTDRIISSGARRCRQTAEVISRAFGRDFPVMIETDLYHGMADTYLDIINRQDGIARLVVVGHNPTNEELLEMLVGADATWSTIPGGYPTAGLAVIERDAESASGWALVDFITP